MLRPESEPRRSQHIGPARPGSLDAWTIDVGGLITRPLTLAISQLAALDSPVSLRSSGKCGAGPGVSDGLFEGLPLLSLASHVGVQPEARYVCVHSAGFTAAFALDSLVRRETILALRKDGVPLDWSDGGPVRVVAVKGACFDMVKWVERVTFEAGNSSATAVPIVRARRHTS